MAIRDLTKGKIRNLPVDPRRLQRMAEILARIDPELDIDVVSGGQAPRGSGGRRVKGSSTRHDVHDGMSDTADVVFSRRGKQLYPNANRELYGRFIQEASSEFPGMGHYDWGIHVGGGTPAFWGPSTRSSSADPAFLAAYRSGRRGAKATNANYAPDYRYDKASDLTSREPPARTRLGALAKSLSSAEKAFAGGRGTETESADNQGIDYMQTSDIPSKESKRPTYNRTGGSTYKESPGAVPGVSVPMDWSKIGWYAKNAFQQYMTHGLRSRIEENPETQSFFQNALAWSWNHLMPVNAAIDLSQGVSNTLQERMRQGGEALTKGFDYATDWLGDKYEENIQLTEGEGAKQKVINDLERDRKFREIQQGGVSGETPPFVLPNGGTIGGAPREFPDMVIPGPGLPPIPPGVEGGPELVQPKVEPPPTIEYPPAPGTIPYPPEEVPFDYNPYLERLREFRPPEFSEQAYKRKMLLSNLSRALGVGATGSGWSGAAGVLARTGRAFGEGTQEIAEYADKRYQETEDAQRQFDIHGVGLEQQIAEKAHEITQRNKLARHETDVSNIKGGDVAAADRHRVDVENQANKYNFWQKRYEMDATFANQAAQNLYEYDKELYEWRTPQILNPTKDGFIIKTIDEDGNVNIKIQRYGDTFFEATDEELKYVKGVQEAFKDIPGESPTRIYTYLIGRERWPTVAGMMAEEAVTNGSATRLVDPAKWEEIQTRAMEAMATRRITENTDEFAEEFPKILAQELMPVMHQALTNPQLLLQMANENIIGAQILYQYLSAIQPKAPIPSIAGPRSTYGGPR